MVAANNLSDLANKATARTNLGVAIGTDVEAALADSGAVVTASTFTATVNKIYRIDTTSNAVAGTLPTSPAVGSQVVFKLVAPNPLVNLFTYNTGGSDKINTSTGVTTGQLKLVGQSALFEYIGSNVWVVVLTDVPLTQLDARYTLDLLAGVTSTSYGKAFLALANLAALLAVVGPTGTPSAANFLNGAGAWVTVPTSPPDKVLARRNF